MMPMLRTQAQYRMIDHNVRIDAWLCMMTTGTVQACISPSVSASRREAAAWMTS